MVDEATRLERARRVRAAREIAGLTQAQLASKLGCAQPRVSGGETGSVPIGEEYVKSVLRACRLPVDWEVVEPIGRLSDDDRELIASLTSVIDDATNPESATRQQSREVLVDAMALALLGNLRRELEARKRQGPTGSSSPRRQVNETRTRTAKGTP
jgi:transcriptional regulator with XRE-family HTH domain